MIKSISEQLSDPQYDYISPSDKNFILKFDAEMETQGYSTGGVITPGYAGAPAWGRYMLIYAKVGVKNKQVAARIYCTDNGIILRLYLNSIEKHIGYIETAPDYIRTVFENGVGDCHRCESRPNGICKFRKTYMLNGESREKCNGEVFQFFNPDIENFPAYIELFREFYPVRRMK